MQLFVWIAVKDCTSYNSFSGIYHFYVKDILTKEQTWAGWNYPFATLRAFHLREKFHWSLFKHFIILYKKSVLHVKAMLHHLIFLGGWEMQQKVTYLVLVLILSTHVCHMSRF